MVETVNKNSSLSITASPLLGECLIDLTPGGVGVGALQNTDKRRRQIAEIMLILKLP